MVERIYQRKCRGTIERSSVIERSGDAHRCLIDIGNAEIDFSHDDSDRKVAVLKGRFCGSGVLAVHQYKL